SEAAGAAEAERATDWLDEIADDEDDLAGDDAIAGAEEVFAGDERVGSIAADGVGPGLSDADVALEEPVDEAAAAEAAAAEMAAVEPPEAEAQAGEEYIDLAALIGGDSEEETTRFRVQETAPTGD